jgi:hypothetical protein
MIVTFNCSTNINNMEATEEIDPSQVASSYHDLVASKVYKATADIVDVITGELGVYSGLATYFAEAQYDR